MSMCRSCNAPIEWRRTLSGTRIPIDPSPVENGNVVLLTGGLCKVVAPGEGTHVSHFATCPNAAAHRKAKTT